LVQPCFTDYCF